jgi:fatty acid desaturase
MDVRQSEKQICRQIKAVENNIRNEYPWLKHQGYYLLICRYVLYSDVNIDVIGMAIFLGSIFLIVALWILYFWTGTNENLSLWKIAFFVCTVAFAISLLHELEHDIIHNLYFRNALWVQDLMFLGIWLSKLHGNPWFRKEMHLKHHIVSGQTDDAEGIVFVTLTNILFNVLERLIGLGLPFGWKRLSVTMHPFGNSYNLI